MLLIVIGLAAADFITGFISAYCNDCIQSSRMRKGGANKIAEIVVMLVACGLDIGVEKLGSYLGSYELSQLAGAMTATAVFVYIALMEAVSILENYGKINPEAVWISKIISKLKKED